MRMRSAMICFTGACAFLLNANLYAGPASAVNGLVSGQVNQLHDKDGEAVFVPNGSGGYTLATSTDVLSAGDILVSQFQLNTSGIQSNDPHAFYDGVTLNEFTGITVLQVASVTANGTNTFSNGSQQYLYSFVAPSANTWHAITGFADPSTGTVLAAYDNSGNNFSLSNGSISSDIASSTAGTLMYALGFTGTTSGTGNDTTVAPNGSIGEGWRAIAPNQLSVFASIGSTESSFQGAVTVTKYGDGPPLALAGNNYGANSPGQFNSSGAYSPGNGLQTNLQVSGDLFQGTTDYPVGSGSNSFIKPVPEPSSLLLLGIGTGAFGLVGFVRRKKQALGA